MPPELVGTRGGGVGGVDIIVVGAAIALLREFLGVVWDDGVMRGWRAVAAEETTGAALEVGLGPEAGTSLE